MAGRAPHGSVCPGSCAALVLIPGRNRLWLRSASDGSRHSETPAVLTELNAPNTALG